MIDSHPMDSQNSVSTVRLLRYWRDCLADGDLINPNLRSLESLALAPEELRYGKVEAAKTEKIFEVAEAELKQRRLFEAEEPPKLRSTRVLVAPLLVRRRRHHAWVSRLRSAEHSPLWIAAELMRDGRLWPDPRHPPWIPRQYLEPVAGSQWTVGSLEAFDRFLTRQDSPSEDDWEDALAFAEGLFQAVTGETMEAYRPEDHEVLSPLLVIYQVEKGFRRPLIDLVDWVLEVEPQAPILRSLVSPPQRKVATAADDLWEPAHRRHVAQMSRRFPLSPSQRQSLHCVLQLSPGEMLAVNGPPGTGKTTLVQSIVASLWVERALQGGEPPLIHVCSTNNQAVTNVLDSFDAESQAGMSENGDPFFCRWLPKLTSYGLYLPSTDRQGGAEKKGYQVAISGKRWQGFPALVESGEYLEAAAGDYLDHARRAFGLRDGGGGLGEILDRLRREMERVAEDLDVWLLLAKEGEAGSQTSPGTDPATFHDPEAWVAALEQRERDHLQLREELLESSRGVPWYEDLLDFLPPMLRRRNRRLTDPLAKRDLAIPVLPRGEFREPLLAHADELAADIAPSLRLARWLLAASRRGDAGAKALLEAVQSSETPWRSIPNVLDVGLRHRLFQLAARYWEGRWLGEMQHTLATGQDLGGDSRQACVRRLQRLAKLTPIFVSTLYRSPRVFDYFDAEEGRGLPLLGVLDLLIVDEAGQVAPEIGAAVLPLAKRAVVMGDEYQIEPIWGLHRRVDSANLRTAGLDPEDEMLEPLRCSSSSLLRTVQTGTRWTAPGRRDGLFLREHRRCLPEVIAYCNELVYEGRLEPKRASRPDAPLPALGWAHVQGVARRVRSSWANPGEARAIARWLRDRREELEAFYGAKLGDLVGVVTPFSAQRVELRRALAGLKAKKSKERPVEAGTIHTFQGAERALIIFSPVYSAETAPGALFFDNGPNMLNVAVSRAKDSFLVLGDMGLFRPDKPQLPSEILASRLFASPENEITDVLAAPDMLLRAQEEGLPVQHITTLEAHRALLQQAFRESQERVLISSPYLSANAVEADGVLAQVRQAVSRGVRVCIVYCRDLHRFPEHAARVADSLRQAGAEVHGADRVHTKHLSVDQSWLVEGSFNWLSAVRDVKNRHQRFETSTRLEHPCVATMIDTVWEGLRAKISWLEGGSNGG